MARYTGQHKLCRREGAKLFLKGERCLTEKCAIERRSYPPGAAAAGSSSQYLLQLPEQKARRYYGLLERIPELLRESRPRLGRQQRDLLRLLETRLDNVIYRLGFAASRSPGAATRARPLPGQRPAREHP